MKKISQIILALIIIVMIIAAVVFGVGFIVLPIVKVAKGGSFAWFTLYLVYFAIFKIMDHDIKNAMIEDEEDDEQ